jgi:hypothetical protein
MREVGLFFPPEIRALLGVAELTNAASFGEGAPESSMKLKGSARRICTADLSARVRIRNRTLRL